MDVKYTLKSNFYRSGGKLAADILTILGLILSPITCIATGALMIQQGQVGRSDETSSGTPGSSDASQAGDSVENSASTVSSPQTIGGNQETLVEFLNIVGGFLLGAGILQVVFFVLSCIPWFYMGSVTTIFFAVVHVCILLVVYVAAGMMIEQGWVKDLKDSYVAQMLLMSTIVTSVATACFASRYFVDTVERSDNKKDPVYYHTFGIYAPSVDTTKKGLFYQPVEKTFST